MKYTEHHSALVNQDLQKRLRNHESRITLLEAENELLRTALQEIRDSIPTVFQNLQCYNTLDSLIGNQAEGIVRPPSNGELT